MTKNIILSACLLSCGMGIAFSQTEKITCDHQSKEIQVHSFIKDGREMVTGGLSIVCFDKGGAILGISYVDFDHTPQFRDSVRNDQWRWVSTKDLLKSGYAIVDVSGNNQEFALVELDNGKLTPKGKNGNSFRLAGLDVYEKLTSLEAARSSIISFQKTREALTTSKKKIGKVSAPKFDNSGFIGSPSPAIPGLPGGTLMGNSGGRGAEYGNNDGSIGRGHGVGHGDDRGVGGGVGLGNGGGTGRRPQIKYLGKPVAMPEAAKEAIINADVILSFTLTNGVVSDVKAQNDPGYGLVKAAIKAIQKPNSFETSGVDGSKPIHVRMKVHFGTLFH